MDTATEATTREGAVARTRVPIYVVSLVLVVLLAILANRLNYWGNLPFHRALLEYPLWAVAVGLVANLALRKVGAWSQVSPAFRTELFLKTGLVLMGASVNVGQIVSVGGRAVVQALIGITAVFFFAWYISRLFGLDRKLRAVISTSVSICGVSAAIAAAGSVVAKKETLAYVTTLVILFALPLMILQPYLAQLLGLSPNVTGAWIGNNIDTTAAVVGAGAIAGDQALKVATIVKLTQNAFIGVAAFLLALYWVLKVERKPKEKPSPKEIWNRFPKFVLGFAVVSIVTSIGLLSKPDVTALTNLRNWFLTLAFVSIGLQFTWSGIRQLGAKPIVAYGVATVFNTLLALVLALVLFG